MGERTDMGPFSVSHINIGHGYVVVSDRLTIDMRNEGTAAPWMDSIKVMATVQFNTTHPKHNKNIGLGENIVHQVYWEEGEDYDDFHARAVREAEAWLIDNFQELEEEELSLE